MTSRRPLLALAAALVMPGLGHKYAGDWVRGLVFLVSIALAVPAAAAVAVRGPSSTLYVTVFIGVAAALGLYAWSVVDAVRLARTRVQSEPQPHQRFALYCVYVVCGYLFALGPATSYVKSGQLEAFHIPSSSMSPTILPGDRIFADKTIGHPGGTRLWRGALALFINPNDRTSIFVKRVIALPGDHVEISGHHVSVNGRDLSKGSDTIGDCEPRDIAHQQCFREQSEHGEYSVMWPASVTNDSEAARERRTWIIPDGQVFVLGDNRGTAIDSRRIGMVPLADVLGVARQVWFSRSPTGGVRWERIGRRLD